MLEKRLMLNASARLATCHNHRQVAPNVRTTLAAISGGPRT